MTESIVLPHSLELQSNRHLVHASCVHTIHFNFLFSFEIPHNKDTVAIVISNDGHLMEEM